eukprot:jgi/Botrbrau1/9797/Bobra.0322s0005.1
MTLEDVVKAFFNSIEGAMVVAGLIATLTYPAVTNIPANASKGSIWSAALALALSVGSLLIFVPLQALLESPKPLWTFVILIIAEFLLLASVLACSFTVVFSVWPSLGGSKPPTYQAPAPTSGASTPAPEGAAAGTGATSAPSAHNFSHLNAHGVGPEAPGESLEAGGRTSGALAPAPAPGSSSAALAPAPGSSSGALAPAPAPGSSLAAPAHTIGAGLKVTLVVILAFALLGCIAAVGIVLYAAFKPE